MKYKLLLINPFDNRRPGISVDRHTRFEPLSLGIIAALTPEHWDVEIHDERVRPLTFKKVDLVGITSFTSTAARAYHLAQTYRKKGIKVVMGGVHPTMCKDEALQYADSVVMGEGESVWKEVINDFENNRLNRLYLGKPADMATLPQPRRDLFGSEYIVGSVQTARGCPMDCDFCSVHSFNKRTHRLRPVEKVLDELETVKQKLVFFTDDNLVGYSKEAHRRTIELFKGMVQRKIKKWWICQASLNFGDDDQLLFWARRSGCRLVFIGIEALETESLQEVNKYMNLERKAQYTKTFEKINNAGISVLGSFLLGMDGDTPEKLKQRENYIINGPLDVIQATIMTPLPGTRLFDRLEKENRLIKTNYPDDWHYYDFNKVVYQPMTMSPQQLEEQMMHCHLRMSERMHIYKKAFKTLGKTRSLSAALMAFQFNRVARKIAGVLY